MELLGVSNPWTLALLLGTAAGVTLLTNWIAGGFRRPGLPSALRQGLRISALAVAALSWAASLLWVLLLFLFGILAVRYVERIDPASLAGLGQVLAWLLFGSLALAASLARARLYRRLERVSAEYTIIEGDRFRSGVGPGRVTKRALRVFLAVGVALVLSTLFLGRRSPPPAPAPSYAQTVDRYYSMRGRSLVFAWLEGSWQATGRRISGHFEVLNAVGESFVLLDRYDGTLFTAGRSADDNLYISRISLSEGAAARVKPLEVHLENQPLAAALDILYQMQREPGLQHIFVSGDLVLPESSSHGAQLQADYAQNRLRKVQAHGDGHFTLRYLTAGELIALAGVEVKTADLVIVATYIIAEAGTPASGPTVTPLPQPAGEGAP